MIVLVSSYAFSLLVVGYLSLFASLKIISPSTIIPNLVLSLSVFTSSAYNEYARRGDLERLETHLIKGIAASFLHILLGGDNYTAILLSSLSFPIFTTPIAVSLLLLLENRLLVLFLTPITVYSLASLSSSLQRLLAGRS